MKTKALSNIESKMNEIDESSMRYQILNSARNFKTSWLELAQYLYSVNKDKLFKSWGYISFETYCVKEIGIKKQTASKLLNSYYFLSKEEPQYLDEDIRKEKPPVSLPDYEAINVLRKAKKNKGISDTDYGRLKENVFEKAVEPKEVGKQFRSMLARMNEVDPEEERKTRRISTIKRMITTLKNLKKEVEILKLLPEKILKDTDKIILSLEENLEE